MTTDHQLEDILKKTPRAVSLLSDGELRRVIDDDDERETRRMHAAAEWLVRGWLEQKSMTKLREELQCVGDLIPELLMQAFESHVLPLRGVWPRHLEQHVSDLLNGTWNDAEGYLSRRIQEFCDCDGIFPVVVPDGAIAVPFRMLRSVEKRAFMDMDNAPVPGWRKEVAAVWESIGIRYKVTLGCYIGFPDNVAAQRTISGNSFALSLLLASSRNPHDFDPLTVLCTGGVVLGRLRGVSGLVAKGELANRIGVKVFAWVGEPSSPPSERPSECLCEFELADESQLHTALSALWDELSNRQLLKISMPEVKRRVAESVKRFPEQAAAADLDRAREIASHFFGRKAQINWLHRQAREQAGLANPRWIWIEGESGCGKTTFAAAFALQLAKNGFSVFTHFFDEEQSLEDACKGAASFLGRVAPIDFSGLADEDGFGRFQYALDELARESPKGPVALIFDGIDEAQGNVVRLRQLNQVSNVLMVFSSTPIRSGNALDEMRNGRPMIEMSHRNQHGLWERGLGRLAASYVEEWLGSITPQIDQSLQDAIIIASQGLPQLVAAFIADFRAGALRDLPTGFSLPTSLDAYYTQRIADHLRASGAGDFNNALLQHILAQLATAHGRWAMDEDSLCYLLSPILTAFPGADIATALTRGGGLLEHVPKLGWRLFHGSLQTHYLQNQPLQASVAVARERWVTAQKEWRDEDMPLNLRRYIARQLPSILAEEKDTKGLLALAKDPEFRRFQEQTFPDIPRAGTDTMRLALKTALAAGNFPAAAEMALLHSAHIEQLSQVDLLQLVQSKRYSYAVALADLAENWDTRLLVKLAVAAALMVNGSPHQAAELLDEMASQRNPKLWTKFAPGSGACAAVLLPLLVGAPTRYFDWLGLDQAFRGDEKLEMAALMGVRGHFVEALELLDREVESKERESTRQKILKQLAASDPRQALLWLDEFTLPKQRAWASVDLVKAFTRRGVETGNAFWHAAALRAEEKLWRRPRPSDHFGASEVNLFLCQRVQCKVERAIGKLSLGDSRSAQKLLDACKRLIRDTPDRPFSSSDPKFRKKNWDANAEASRSKARALVSYGCGRALCGDTAKASAAFRMAFDLQEQRLTMKWESPISNAKLLSGFIAELAQTLPCEPVLEWYRLALERIETVISRTKREKQIELRFVLCRRLATIGLIEDAEVQWKQLGELNAPKQTAELQPYFAACAAKFGLDGSKYKARFNKTDDQLLIAARIARDWFVSGNLNEAVQRILADIRLRPAIGAAQSWGPACVGGAIGSVASHNADAIFAAKVFYDCEQRLGNTPPRAKPRYLAELAEAQYSGGLDDDARRVIRTAANIVQQDDYPAWNVAANVLSINARWENMGVPDLTCLIEKLDNSRPFEFAKNAAKMIPVVARHGFSEIVNDMIDRAEKQISAISDEKGRWTAHAEVILALARAAVDQSDLRSVAIIWHNRLNEEIDQRGAYAKASGTTQRLFRPQKLKHAQALLAALDDDFPQALRIARGIRVPEPRSDALRDLALLASCDPTRHGVKSLMLGISHRPDTHLPRVLAALADAGAKDDACDLFPACAEYFDATCRGVATLVKLLKPGTEELTKIWHACGAALDLFPEKLQGEQHDVGAPDPLECSTQPP